MSWSKSCQVFRRLTALPITQNTRFLKISPSCMSDEYKLAQQQRLELIKKNHAEFKAEATTYKQGVVDNTKRWVEQNEIYYGSQRDFENFPTLKQQEYHPTVRFGFVPDKWFQAFYDKTGVTGPYLFLGGASIFALSKEYWVMDHEFFEVPVFIIIVMALYNKVGPILQKHIDERRKKWFDGVYFRKISQARKETEARIEALEETSAQIKATPAFYEAAKENVDLQLEASYRQRLLQARDAVSRTLQYHADRDRAMRNYRQQHMVNWLVNSVVGSITPQLEKDAFRQCITDLQRLSSDLKKSGVKLSAA